MNADQESAGHADTRHVLADCRKVSKAQILKFVEAQFALADLDRDGSLDIDELQTFLQAIVHPQL